MKSKTFTVKTKDNEEWTFTVNNYPENWDEAKQNFGEDGAFDILESGLDIRLQNLGRDQFRKGKSQEEVEEQAASYQPGSGRSSKKQRAFDLITEKAVEIGSDPQLKTDVNAAFKAGDWDTILNLLGNAEE